MRYIAMIGMLFVTGCSVPTAVSEGFSDISKSYDETMKHYEVQNDLDSKYGVDNDSNRALVAFAKGNLDEAQIYATKALQQNPTDNYALMVMAVVNDTLGMPNKAGFYYQAILENKNLDMTTLGNLRLNMPQSLYESAFARLKVINLKQAPFIVNQENSATPVFEIKETFVGDVPAVGAVAMKPVIRTGMDLFTTTERNIISRFLTLKALAEKGYITKEEFMARRGANIGGLLPLVNPVPAKTVALPVPTTDAIMDRFDSMKNAYELKSMTAGEYINERDVILEALLPMNSIDKMAPTVPPANLLEGADDVRKLEVLLNLELITKKELDTEKAAIEDILRMGGKPLPTSSIKSTKSSVGQNDTKSKMPTPLIPKKTKK